MRAAVKDYSQCNGARLNDADPLSRQSLPSPDSQSTQRTLPAHHNTLSYQTTSINFTPVKFSFSVLTLTPPHFYRFLCLNVTTSSTQAASERAVRGHSAPCAQKDPKKGGKQPKPAKPKPEKPQPGREGDKGLQRVKRPK